MDFSVEAWACIDVIKICKNIDPELKHAQVMFKQVGGNVKFSTFSNRREYIQLLKRFDLLQNQNAGDINFFDIIIQAINNKYFVLSEQLLHRHVLRDRIHEDNNKVLRAVINQKNNTLAQYLLTLSKVKAALVEPQNKVLIAAVLNNMVEVVDSLISIPGVKETVHHDKNAAFFQSMLHEDLIIFRKLVILPKVKDNFFQVLPRVCEYVNPTVLANFKNELGLNQFNENDIIKYALEVSRAGHVLGLSNKHLPTDAIFPMNFSGSYSSKSLSWILELLAVFLNGAPQSELKTKVNIIFSAFKTCDHFRKKMFDSNYNEKAGQTSHIDLFNRFLLNKMVYLVSGWERHGVSIVLYKIDPYTIFIGETNRGEHGNKNLGSNIFKVTKTQALTADWIRKIQLTQTYEEYLSLLKLVIDVSTPVFSLPQKPQKYPTCGYINKVAAIEPMLLLLRANFLGELTKVGGLQKVFNRDKRNDYKHITNTFREQATNRIIYMIEMKFFNVELMYDLIRSIILQHPGKTDCILRPQKFEKECQRARNLLKALPEFYQEKFKKNHHDLYDLIDFNSVINPKQNWLLVDYHKKRAQDRAHHINKSNQIQSQPRLSLKHRY